MIDEGKRNKIIFTLPSNNAKFNIEVSEEQVKLKDRLMKLIIDTKDEAIELKVNGEQYRKIGIHDEWRQVDFNSNKAAYFSYQEKAAKDFIFRFNKCGILSDQVGMGKTIEAGMIISELAYRKELGSLLILVPNENMAEKWEIELARKFGFRNFYKNLAFLSGKEERIVEASSLPKVASVKSLENMYALIFSAYDEIKTKKNNRLDEKILSKATVAFDKICSSAKIQEIRSIIAEIIRKQPQIDSKEFKMEILKEIFAPLIKELVGWISQELGYKDEFDKLNYSLDLSGAYYHIVDMYLDTPITTPILVNGIIERLIDKELIVNSIIGEFDFIKAIEGKKVVDDINVASKNAQNNDDRLEYISLYRSIAQTIRKKYTILIVSKIVTQGENELFNLLNFCLNEEYESESTRHCSVSVRVEKGYNFIDLLIDMSYKTLIVDEAHDYIKVSHKQHMREDIVRIKDYESRQKDGIEFSDLDLATVKNSANYYVFPLYDDYYFVEKDCMYLKVKALAERSYRKIFMTATPIKSDMIDFYLLYLLADNSDTNTYARIRKIATGNDISAIAALLINNMSSTQKRAMNYCTYEEAVLKYIYQYYKSYQGTLTGTFNDKIKEVIVKTISEKTIDSAIVEEICINRTRIQFQQTFTIKNAETNEEMEINSIANLVSSDEGIEQWQNMYSQIGIRSTRHQTFRLDDEHLELIKPIQRDKYRNLPIWSRRNGTIIYIHKKDNYFDLVVKERLDQKKLERENAIKDDDELRRETIDIPKNREVAILQKKLDEEIASIHEEDYTEKLKESKIREATRKFESQLDRLEIKYAPKETAMVIYEYINDQLSGSLNVADYYSTDVDYDDFKLHMVVKLMTDGLEVQGVEQPKKIDGKVLLFADASTQKKVLEWLQNEAMIGNKTLTPSELASYVSRYKHQPLWYYNSLRENEEDKWVITTDIKALKEKKGNYLIVVEPNKYEEGVDLQSSNILINFDIKFCPLKMEQRIGRIDRVKLGDTQPQLDIISFTPLNDMSGFMVDFLANELQMFSCWKGDTTGIVSMPLGDKPNSATFESAILAINEAYKNLYSYTSSKFIASCKRISELGRNFSNSNFDAIDALQKQEKQIFEDFKYLKQVSGIINKIILNSDCTNNDSGDEGFVIFDELCVLAREKAKNDGEISGESISNHKNDLKELKTAIESYYNQCIKLIQDEMDGIKNAYTSTIETGKIESSNSDEKESYTRLKNRLDAFNAELAQYQKSKLFKLSLGSLGIEKIVLDEVLNPILNRFKYTINKYLDILIELFEKFCLEVTDKSAKMTRFISYLTIEEFRVMADNYE